MELKDYLRILRRQWLTVVIVAAIFIGISYMYISNQPPVYSAQAELQVKESAYPTGAGLELPVVQEYTSRETRIALLKARPVLRKAIEDHLREYFPSVLKKDQPTRDIYEEQLTAGINSLKGGLSASQEKSTDIVFLSYADPNDRKTVAVVNAVAEAYRDFSKDAAEEGLKNAIAFIEKVIAERDLAIAETVNQLTHFPLVFPPTPAEIRIKDLVDRQSTLRETINTGTLEISAMEDQIQILSTMLAEGAVPPRRTSLTQTTPVDKLREAIHAQERAITGLLERYTVDHPAVKSARAELARMKTLLNEESERQQWLDHVQRKFETMGTMQDHIHRIRTLQNQNVRLARKLEEVEKEYEEIIVNEPKTAEQKERQARIAQKLSLERQLEFLKSSREGLEKTRYNLQVNHKMLTDPVTLIELARRPYEMPRPGSRSLPFLGLTGIIVAIASAYLLEYLNTSVRTEHDVRRYLNLPLLGVVIRIKEEGQRLLMNIAPKSTIAEVFNATSTLIETHARETNGKIFMVASSKPEEGKSTITSNLAVALARSGLKVVLIDCDLRKAILHKFFNVDNSIGLASYLLGQSPGTPLEDRGEQYSGLSLDQIMKPTEVEGLTLIPAGPHPKNPVSLLKSKGFKKMLDEVRQRADLVLVDVPPTNIAVDTMLLASQVDGVILLVSAGETNKDEVTAAKRAIESAKGKLIGCILNKVTIESRGYYYYYYYYYYDTYKYYRES